MFVEMSHMCTETSFDVEMVGLFGHPVGHSLSPAMHEAAIRSMGIQAVYKAFDVAPQDLPAAMAALRLLQFRGINLTIPHKEAALPLVDELTSTAARVGAINTVLRDGQRLIGDNTDGAGYVAALQSDLGLQVAGMHVAILGAGGAAKAIADALLDEGCQRVQLYNRNGARAQALGMHLQQYYSARRIMTAPLAEFNSAGLDLLINTTPVGMLGHLDGASPVAESHLRSDLIVSDIVYRPLHTPLLVAAAAHGAKIHDGTGMLVFQGALALSRWFGVVAPSLVMRNRLLDVLQQEELEQHHA